MFETDKEILFINDLSRLLSMRAPAIRQNILNERFHIVPPPVKLGKRYAWHRRNVEKWIAGRFGLDEGPATPSPEEEKRGRGRPRMTA